MKNSERRVETRTSLLLKVAYQSEAEFRADYTENVSSGGVFIATDDDIPIGTVLQFEISFPGLLEPIPMRGTVRWIRRVTQPHGVGVQFLRDGHPDPYQTYTEMLARMENAALAPAPAFEPFRVLLVDDNEVVRDMLRYAIQKLNQRNKSLGLNLQVQDVQNGKEAWDRLQKESFSLLILDLFMPVMEGQHLIHLVRQEERLKSLPIIVVSGGTKEDRAKALQAGADIFLNKPIQLKELLDTIERLILTHPAEQAVS